MGARKSGASRSGARKAEPTVAAQREHDSPLPALVEVAADYYWEQDAEHRFTLWRHTAPSRSGALGAGALIGKTSADLCAPPAGDPEHWVRHRALLEARKPFRDVVHTFAGADGHHLSLSGAPAFSANGTFLGYRGLARESGALVRMERLLALEGALLRGLAEADDLASALPLVVAETCEFARWTNGAYWSIEDETRALRRAASYGAVRAMRSVLMEGEAAPGWLEKDPVWLADAGDGRDAWTSTLVVPVTDGSGIIGALEFCSADTASPDAGFLRVLRGVAAQLGHLHARVAAADRLRESESRFASTMALAAIGIAHVDDRGRFLYVNPQLCSMLGYTESELLARTTKDLSHPDDVDTTHELGSRLRQGAINSFKAEKRYVRKDGAVVWVGLTVAVKRDRDGHKLYDISIIEDISARKEAEECIQYLANHDALTGLPNRTRFAHLLTVACDAARRDRRRFAVLFVDLDRFKAINDSLGHDAGDAMLRAAATRLRSCVRASDVVARLGGDEFVVLLQDVTEQSVAAKVAGNVLKALAEPLAIQGQNCKISASIGICLHPDGDQEDQAVLRNADMAMYLAKQSGKNGYRLYLNELNVLSAECAAIESGLRAALERNEFVIEFDARLDAAGVLKAVEARIRWTDPKLAAVAADKIARAAEAAGLLVPINQRMLRAACEAGAAWQRAGAPAVPVAVGIAAGQITDPKFAGDVRDVLAAAAFEPGMLELSASEDVLLYDSARSARTLTALKSLGVRIAIDAFGTGKASFADLQRFPIGALKLHSSRLDGIAFDIDKQRYAEGVIALGHALGLEVVATGVANVADADYLRAGGCAALQGSVVPQAMSAVECEALLRGRR